MLDFIYQILLEGWKLWLIVGILFFLAEGANAGTFALFFGGVGAWITALVCYFSLQVTESGTMQLLVFAGTSLLSLYGLRSAVMRLLHIGETSDSGSFVGKTARVLTDLSKTGVTTGLVSFEGTEWRAMPSADAPDLIPEGTMVSITRAEGLTLYVEPLRR